MKKPYVGRVVAVASTVISLALAVLPVVANMDWTSTVGCIGGIVGVLGVTQKWLGGLQAHEARVATAAKPVAQWPMSFTSGATTSSYAYTAPSIKPQPPEPDFDEDADVPEPNPAFARNDLDDPEYQPRARKPKRRTR